jgi:hypothetical protein
MKDVWRIASRVAGPSKTAGGCAARLPKHGRPFKILVPSLMPCGDEPTGTRNGSHPHGAGSAFRRQAPALVGLRRSFARFLQVWRMRHSVEVLITSGLTHPPHVGTTNRTSPIISHRGRAVGGSARGPSEVDGPLGDRCGRDRHISVAG